MGLMIQQSTGLTKPLRIVDSFKVEVKHLTRSEIEKLSQATEGKDEDEQAAMASAAYIADWSGCTPAAAARIGVKLADTQPLDDHGCIPYDRDAARDLWRNAYANRFMLPIMACSRSILEAIEAEKELSKNGYGGWSLPSTTL